jgi:tetratricopeptide (TPR) repeat protein
MDKTAMFIKGLFMLALMLAIVIYLMWRSLKRSREPLRLISRWLMTGIILYGIFSHAIPLVVSGGSQALLAVPLALVYGLVLALIWTPSIAGWFGEKVEALYTGGETPPEPKPVYSGAIAKRINGQFQEALYLIHEQLEKFPNDFAGQMLIAEIQAQNLNDLPAAETSVLRICQQPEQSPSAVAFALNSLADWYLAVAKDSAAAGRILEKIIALLPDSEHSMQAAQRLAHLTPQEKLLEPLERKPIKLPPGIRDLGIRKVDPSEIIKTRPPEEEANEIVAHLQVHPLDVEAREKLALIYAEHFQRLDLASEQLEQLITCPHLPPKQVVHWLNMLANLQIRMAGDLAAASATLQRIIDLYPNSAFASQAQDRLTTLPGELRPQRENQSIKMGVYEQYLGLKMKPK